MMKRYQRGDAGATMLAVMVIVMIGFFWHQGRGHGSGWGGHMSGAPPAAEAASSPLDLLDEAYARGEMSRDEYLQKREDLRKR